MENFGGLFLDLVSRGCLGVAVSLFLSLVFSPAQGWAQRVDEIRGEKVRIAADGLRFNDGQRWEAIDGTGEVVGWIEITQVKDAQAYGVIREGHAVKGANLRLKEDKRITTQDEVIRHRKWFIGPSFMEANATALKSGGSTVDVHLNGTQWGLQIGADQVLSPRQLLRLRLGNDLISAKGTTDDTSLCKGDLECELWTHYLTASLGFVFQAMPEGADFNAGLSMAFAGFLPVSRESDIFNTSKISIDGGFEAGAFVSFKTNPITWFEFSVQQVFLRETSTSRYRLSRFNLSWVQNF